MARATKEKLVNIEAEYPLAMPKPDDTTLIKVASKSNVPDEIVTAENAVLDAKEVLKSKRTKLEKFVTAYFILALELSKKSKQDYVPAFLQSLSTLKANCKKSYELAEARKQFIKLTEYCHADCILSADKNGKITGEAIAYLEKPTLESYCRLLECFKRYGKPKKTMAFRNELNPVSTEAALPESHDTVMIEAQAIA